MCYFSPLKGRKIPPSAGGIMYIFEVQTIKKTASTGFVRQKRPYNPYSSAVLKWTAICIFSGIGKQRLRLHHPPLMDFISCCQIKLDSTISRVCNSRHPVCYLFLPSATVVNEADQIHALHTVVFIFPSGRDLPLCRWSHRFAQQIDYPLDWIENDKTPGCQESPSWFWTVWSSPLSERMKSLAASSPMIHIFHWKARFLWWT